MTANEPTIAFVTITPGPGPLPRGVFDQAPRVIATLTTGVVVELFSFYERERSFDARQFVGLTLDQGRQLKFTAQRRPDTTCPPPERRGRSSWLQNDRTILKP